MRKVIRSSVPVPNNLMNLTPTQIEHLSNYKKISSSVYRHQDVINSLDELYFKKCYICECDVSNGYDVEHFKPKKEFLSLAYTWENLHKSCTSCNLEKEKKVYKEFDVDGNVIDILLLDPSDNTYNIEDLICYNINADLTLKDNLHLTTTPLLIRKAKQTATLINTNEKLSKRKSAINSFLHCCIENLVKHKERLIALNNSSIDFTFLEGDKEIFNELEKIDMLYIGDSCEYSTSIRINLFKIFTLNYNEIKQIINKLKIKFNI